MTGDIMKQFDSSDFPDGAVADDLYVFVEAEDIFRSRGDHEWTEHRYTAYLYKRPYSAQSSALRGCGHQHRSLDAVYRCARRLLRRWRA